MKNILLELDNETQYLESIDNGNSNLEIKLENLKKNNWEKMKISDLENDLDQKLGIVHMNFDCSIHDIYSPDFSSHLSGSKSQNSNNSFLSNDFFLNEEKKSFDFKINRSNCKKRKSVDHIKSKKFQKLKYFSFDDLNPYIDESSSYPDNLKNSVSDLKKKAKNLFSDFLDIEYIEQVWNTNKISNMNISEKPKKRIKVKNESLDCKLSLIQYNSKHNSLSEDSLLNIINKFKQEAVEIPEKKFRKRKGISISNSLGGSENMSNITAVNSININQSIKKDFKNPSEVNSNNHLNPETVSNKFVKKNEIKNWEEIKIKENEIKTFRIDDEPLQNDQNKINPIRYSPFKKYEQNPFIKNPPNTIDDKSAKKIIDNQSDCNKIGLKKFIENQKTFKIHSEKESKNKTLSSNIKKLSKTLKDQQLKIKNKYKTLSNTMKLKKDIKQLQKILDSNKNKPNMFSNLKNQFIDNSKMKNSNPKSICKTDRVIPSPKSKIH